MTKKYNYKPTGKLKFKVYFPKFECTVVAGSFAEAHKIAQEVMVDEIALDVINSFGVKEVVIFPIGVDF